MATKQIQSSQTRVCSKQEQQNQPMIYKLKFFQGKSLIESLSYILIRPPKFIYNYQLLNPVDQISSKFQLSIHMIPFRLNLYSTKNMKYVILYLHGNSSSSYEGYLELSTLPKEVGLACFDFAACGNRQDKQYITLGYQQAYQVDIVADYLRELNYIVIGWGRSMGSVALLLSKSIKIMIADSPFANLVQLCKNNFHKILPCFLKCFASCMFPILIKKIAKNISFNCALDIYKLQIDKFVQSESYSTRNVCLIGTYNDQIVSLENVQRIYKSFQGKATILSCDGTHQSIRPQQIRQKCFEFIEECLKTTIQSKEQKIQKQLCIRKQLNLT